MMINSEASNQAIVLYIPVIHQGYLTLIERYPTADVLLIDRELLKPEFRSLQKDIRALATEQVVVSLQALLSSRKIIHLKTKDSFFDLTGYDQLILPEDEVSEWLEKQYLSNTNVIHDSIFLRWGETAVKQQQDIAPDEVITHDQLHQQMMQTAAYQAEKSSDWWRQIGAALVKNGELVAVAHNHHAPSDQQQYIFGDPRANFGRGADIELSTAVHAEEAVVAHAAAQGISLRGADLYVTTFPCPYCARLVAYSGIKRIFFKDGYSVLDGEGLLRSQNIEIIKVVE